MRIGILVLWLVLAGCCERTGVTTLTGAARNGDIATMQALIEGGADLNQRGGVNGWPPLMHAIHKNQSAAVATLLEAGADPNQRASGGLPGPVPGGPPRGGGVGARAARFRR